MLMRANHMSWFPKLVFLVITEHRRQEMPLYKRTHFHLLKQPEDLDPHELVYQVRFTKEIFRDYQEYLNRLNLYRQRVWTCKATGKANLTYEEALVSERRANEKVQQIPKELVAPILNMVQYSTLRLKDLVYSISTKLQERSFKGAELYAWKEQSVCACRILNILEDDVNIRYEVGWFDKNKKVTSTSIVDSDGLMRKKLPFSRSTLKSFMRESTSRSSPWVIHEKLAKKHGISTEPPGELRNKLSAQNGSCGTKDGHRINGDKKRLLGAVDENNNKKRKKKENGILERLLPLEKKANKEEQKLEEPIRYPIEDLLVKPGPDDPVFTERPIPCREFSVPMDCVGDLLMVWDFCSSFCRLLRLWPYSLDDFEKAICHKDSDLVLIIESHSAMLRVIMKNEGEFFEAVQKKRRKSKITKINWTEFLCDFIEMVNKAELSSYVATIKRGHYGLLDPQVKLGILQELVAESLTTDAVREKLDEYVEQQRALVATKREELRKKREEKYPQAEESGAIANQEAVLQNGKGNLPLSEVERKYAGNQNVPHGGNGKILQANGNHISENGMEHKVANTVKAAKRPRLDGQHGADDVQSSSGIKDGKKTRQSRKDKEKEAEGKNMEERRIGDIERAIEKQFIHTNTLGKDRNYNRYWFFRRDGRLFVECSDSKQWGYYTSKEELDAFMGSLNPKGEREGALKRQLEKYYSRISAALQKRSRDIAQKTLLEESVLRRSTRVRAQPRDSPAMAFLRYINKWKED
uniref:DDT domain-containing protein DDB_G0282237 n=3 Tax=Anthurium amnicola TaxID=1678845 RepID=A0A1D1ZJD0_9ARAE